MKTSKGSCSLNCERFFILLLVYITVSVGLSAPATNDSKVDTKVINFSTFRKALEALDDVKATAIGDSVFGQLEQKYKDDAGFAALKSKLVTAESLAKQMVSELREATNKQMLAVADKLFDKKKKDDKDGLPLVASAKSFYETSTKLFSKPVRIDELGDDEKTFLAQYYDLKLRLLSSAIAKAGQALAIAEPSFEGTHDYVLVLPLLHASDRKSVNIDVLPRWMQQPEQLAVFSDSCLLHFGFPFHAMMVAKQSAQLQKTPFSELDFYRYAAKKCGKSHPHTAADCLHKAIDYVPDNEPNTTVTLQFETVQLWLNSENYALAAGEAKKVTDAYPNDQSFCKAIWLHYYGLSRSNNIEAILAGIDEVINDERCQAYKPKLMYIKWLSLRNERDQDARKAALEQEILKRYRNDPMVASVLLARAIDFIAHEEHNYAYESLTEVIEKFPSTKAAEKAKRILARSEAEKSTKK